MNTTLTCPECGKPVAPNNLRGICPECMMKVGLAPQTAEAGPGGTLVVNAAPPPSVAEIARLFPQLEILGLLGSGGMGAIYKARQPRLDRFVALKILLASDGQLRDARFTERFEREARALAKLSHPNIVTMYEFGQAEGMPYFIMEFVDGLNLRQLEQAGKLSPREALQIVPQICEALQFAHDAGVVHRDIKPENILLDQKGRVKIADFGIAKILGRDSRGPTLTEGQQVIGTPHYMAPEQVEKPRTVDHRADIYSLGVVFYEMLTGELPLGKFSPPSKAVQVDVRLDEVVLHALEKQPERRYQHASQVKTDVETIAASERTTAGQNAPAARPAWLAPVIVGAVLALAGVVVALTGGLTRAKPPVPPSAAGAGMAVSPDGQSQPPVLSQKLTVVTNHTAADNSGPPSPQSTTNGPRETIARLRVEQAEREFQRVKELYTRKLVSAWEHERARLALAIATREQQGDTNGVSMIRLELAKVEFRRVCELYDLHTVGEADYQRARISLDVAAAEYRRDAVSAAQARRQWLEGEFQRATELYEKRLIPQADYENAKVSLQAATAEVKATQANAAAAAQTNGASSQPGPAPAFGPVIERVIAHSGTNAFLDLDSGQFVPYTGPKLDSGKIPQGRIDLYYRPTLNALDDLATIGMVCVSIAKGQAAWAQPPSPATICTLLDEAAKRSGSGGEAIFSPSTIHAFRTRDGAVGLLLSLGASDDSGIRVRYRLITNNVAAPVLK